MTQITAYKGFDPDLKCRGYQYEIGKEHVHDGLVKACGSGFHACENPLDVFNYYPPNNSRFAIVKMDGTVSREDDGDSKIASARLTIEAEIGLPTLISRAIEWIHSKVDWDNKTEHATGDQSAASNTGNQSAASNTGDYSAASNTGNQSAASNTGDYSAASNTGHRSAASNTGNQSAASNTGHRSAAEVSGQHSVAMASGEQGRARASEGGAIVLVYRNDDGELIHIRASKVGENGVQPDVWYQLNEDGEFVEVEL